MAQQHNKAIQ